jgi:hypothetical protein
VLIGGNCFTESIDILSIFPWRASARCCSWAASCRSVGSDWDGFTESSGFLPTLFDTQVAEQSNEHQTTLRLAASSDGEASPVPVRKSHCFEARSAS